MRMGTVQRKALLQRVYNIRNKNLSSLRNKTFLIKSDLSVLFTKNIESSTVVKVKFIVQRKYLKTYIQLFLKKEK